MPASRPLSPHLQIYKWQITMVLSISHRATGVALSVGAAWALMHYVFDQPFSPAAAPALLVALAMIAIAVSIGMLTSRDVFRETPMAALRDA